jgi:hypothetical protein
MTLSLRERNNLAAQKYRKNHPERRRFIQAPKRGTTKAQADAKLLEQENKCAICEEIFIKTPHIDHDHVTNQFRGLLCRACNHMLGNARDSITVLQSAVVYLKKYGAYNGKEAPIQPHGG